MNQIQVAHREARSWSDKVAMGLMRVARWGMDTVTGYAEEGKPGTSSPSTSWRRRPMDERKWLVRIVFLESIAGVPGMVGGMLRHLHSLRRMKRDNGWHVFFPLESI
jgi:Alternative oxidase